MAVGFLAVGCSEDESIDRGPGGIVGSGDTNPGDASGASDVSDISDATDASDVKERDIAQSDAVEDTDSADGLDIVEDEDTVIPPSSGSCEQITDLGDLQLGTQTVEFTVDAQIDFIKTSCSPAGQTSAEKIYQLTPSQPLDISTSGGSNINVELRSNTCGDDTDIVTCNPDGDLQASLSPGVTYYLLVEADGAADGGTVTFELEANSPTGGCQAGSTSCVSTEAVELCEQGGATQQYSCPEDCGAEEGACIGDRCAAPIEVSSTKRVQGTLEALTNRVTTYSGCTNSTQNGPVRADGPELTFALAGLTPGQIIDVDTSRDAIDNVILIQQGDCGGQASCVEPDATTSETATHTVDVAGDYTVIVDADAAASGSFDYEIVLR